MGLVNLVFTKTLTGTASMSITDEMALKKVTFNVTSTTAGTITGTANAGGNAPNAISLTSTTGSLTIEASDGAVLDGISVSVPSECTMQIVGLQ